MNYFKNIEELIIENEARKRATVLKDNSSTLLTYWKESVIPKLSWTHYIQKLSIKNENERNYYINQVILNNLSVRELKREIQNKAFDRLSYADKEHIEIISDDNIIRVIYPEHEHFIYIFQLLPQCGNN